MWLDWFRSTPATSKKVELPTTEPPRAVRFHLDVVISFVVDDRIHVGQCINVSESGLLARFDTPPELWMDGKVEVESGEHYLDIRARVARRQDNEVGFAFSLETENDRAAARILIHSVVDQPVLEPVDVNT